MGRNKSDKWKATRRRRVAAVVRHRAGGSRYISLGGCGLLLATLAGTADAATDLPHPRSTKWWFIDLGVPCGCQDSVALHGSLATSLNDCGEVVGHTTKLLDGDDCGSRAFLWTICDTIPGVPSQRMWRLDLLFGSSLGSVHESSAWSINNLARIAGGVRPGGGTAEIPSWWDMLQQTGLSASPCDLGEFASSDIGTQPGVARGVSFPTDFDLAGTLDPLSAAKAFTADPSLSPTVSILSSSDAEAFGIARIGSVTTIVGREGNQAVAWQESGSGYLMTTLAVPTSPGLGSAAVARALNSGGEVAGETTGGFPASASSVIYWPSLATIGTSLASGTLTQTQANSISDADSSGAVTIVGSALARSLGAVWYRRSLIGAWSSVPADELQCGLPSAPGTVPGLGACIRVLHDVNSAGWMVGEFQPPDAAHARAMLLVPMSCQADLTGNGHVDAADLAALNVAWGLCASVPCAADLTGDSMVDAQDMARLLLEWGRDCAFEQFCETYSCESRNGPAGEGGEIAEAVAAAIGVFGFTDCVSFCEWVDGLSHESSCCVREMLLWELESDDDSQVEGGGA